VEASTAEVDIPEMPTKLECCGALDELQGILDEWAAGGEMDRNLVRGVRDLRSLVVLLASCMAII
jgi:hypothetical protein